jgi:hypothetical protein
MHAGFPDHLVGERDLQLLSVIEQRRRNRPFRDLGLHGEPGFLVHGHEKIDFLFFGVPQKIERRPIAVAVMEIMAGLEEVGGDEVFEAGRRVINLRPVP